MTLGTGLGQCLCNFPKIPWKKMFFSSPLSQLFWFSKQHMGSVRTPCAGEGSCPYSHPALSAVGSSSEPSRGPAQLKVRVWWGRGQAFLPFLGTVSAISQLYLMASSTQVCRGAGGEQMPAGSFSEMWMPGVSCSNPRAVAGLEIQPKPHLQQKDNTRRGKSPSWRK